MVTSWGCTPTRARAKKMPPKANQASRLRAETAVKARSAAASIAGRTKTELATLRWCCWATAKLPRPKASPVRAAPAGDMRRERASQ